MDDLRTLIGKTIVVGVRGADPDSPELIEELAICAEAHAGGVILFDRDLATRGDRNIRCPKQVKELSACLRERLGDELLIMIDQEGGAVARLGADRSFDPGVSAAEFALLDEAEQRRCAAAQASQLSALGINVNLAPTVDLSIEGSSTVIAGLGRSFGPDPTEVLRCASVWIEEHQRAGVAVCLKHFPGHGSASGDTHESLVDITDRASADAEIAPFQALCHERGVMVMTGHLLDQTVDPELPASLSAAHTEGSLRHGLGFNGVVVTDSIDMGAISARWSPGAAAALAIGAGADLVIDGVNARGPVRTNPALEIADAIARAIREGRIVNGEQRLLASAARVDRLLAEVRQG